MICQSCRALLRTNPLLVRRSTTTTSAALPRLHQLVSLRQSSTPRAFTTTSQARLAAASPSSSSSETESPSLSESMTPTESGIASQLADALSPTAVLVQDVSGGCGSMYAIDITAEKFRGQTMLKQQRMVNAALGDLVKGWHGVQIKTRVP